jgi:hypothetical protein
MMLSEFAILAFGTDEERYLATGGGGKHSPVLQPSPRSASAVVSSPHRDQVCRRQLGAVVRPWE